MMESLQVTSVALQSILNCGGYHVLLLWGMVGGGSVVFQCCFVWVFSLLFLTSELGTCNLL